MEVRDQLVRAGVELLERDGRARLTLRAIARRAGVSHGAPRHHFPTFAGLLAAVARAGLEDLDAELAPALLLADPLQALRQAARTYVRFAVARPEMFELVARHDLLEGAGGELRTITSRWIAIVSERVEEIDPSADESIVVALWSGIQGLAVVASRRTAEAAAGTAPDVDRVIDVLLQKLVGSAS